MKKPESDNMLVLIDAVGPRIGGAITVARNLLYYFCRLRPDWEFRVLILPEAMEALKMSANPNMEFVAVPGARGGFGRVIWQQWRLPRLALENRADVIFSLVNIGPRFSRVPTVVYYHQAIHFFRENTGPKILSRQHIWEYFRKRSVLAGFRGAAKVITQTEVMRQAVVEQTNIPPARVVCVSPGYPAIQRGSPEDEVRTNAALDKIRMLSPPVGIYLSHPSYHKNFGLLFKAAEKMKSQSIPGSIALTLDKKWPGNSYYNGLVRNYLAEIRRLNIEDRIVFIGSIPPSGVNRVFEACHALVFPSLIESFPQPLVEAMKAQLPLLVADRPYAREIVGNAGLFFNPLDDGSDLAHLMEIFSASTGKVRQLRQMSFDRSLLYSYENAAATITDMLLSAGRK